MFKTLDVFAASLITVQIDGGYIKTTEFNNTRDKVLDALDNAESTSQEREDALPVADYARAMPGHTPYARKVRLLACRETCGSKDVGILASVAGSYVRDLNRIERGADSVWFGDEGDRVDLVLKVDDTRTGAGRFGCWWLYKFVNAEGSEATWFASQPQDVAVGDTVRVVGRIKKCDEYKGVKQTSLTRCKVELVDM